MRNKKTVLSASEAKRYYDHFAKKQDSQGFYEDPALDDLIVHAGFQEAGAIFEFGCGTGKFAERLLGEHLGSSATYFGCDVSPVMVELATQRMMPFAERATVIRSGEVIRFPLSDHSVDRVLCNYVLDLLSERDARLVFAEALRVLKPEGKLCLVSITNGTTLPARLVASIWTAVFHIRASLVGGCRPIQLEAYANQDQWQSEYRNIVTAFGVPSEILVVKPRLPQRDTPADAPEAPPR